MASSRGLETSFIGLVLSDVLILRQRSSDARFAGGLTTKAVGVIGKNLSCRSTDHIVQRHLPTADEQPTVLVVLGEFTPDAADIFDRFPETVIVDDVLNADLDWHLLIVDHRVRQAVRFDHFVGNAQNVREQGRCLALQEMFQGDLTAEVHGTDEVSVVRCLMASRKPLHVY